MFKSGEILSKKTIIILFMFLVLICGILFINLKIKNTKTEYEKRVTSYLVDEKGYEKKEIKSVEGIYGVKLPSYYVVVILKMNPM